MGSIESQLKSHVRLNDKSLYRISKETGVSLAYLSRWMQGKQGLGKHTIPLIAESLGFTLKLQPMGRYVSDK